MNILSIETCGSIGSVAFTSEHHSKEKTFARGMHHGRDLILGINELLAEENEILDNIDLIVVDSGPGSYTGLRIGIITAKTLAFCTGKRVFALGSLDILVHNLTSHKKSACALIDAKQGEVYFCVYTSRDGLWERISDYSLEKPEVAIAKIPQGACIIGDGIRKIENIVSASRFDIVGKENWRVSARRAAELARRLYKPQETVSPHELQPLYMRRPIAEVIREQNS